MGTPFCVGPNPLAHQCYERVLDRARKLESSAVVQRNVDTQRAAIVALAVHKLTQDPEPKHRAELAAIISGTGYLDLADDLPRLRLLAQRIWTLLLDSYNEVALAGQYLFRNTATAERFPTSLIAASRHETHKTPTAARTLEVEAEGELP